MLTPRDHAAYMGDLRRWRQERADGLGNRLYGTVIDPGDMPAIQEAASSFRSSESTMAIHHWEINEIIARIKARELQVERVVIPSDLSAEDKIAAQAVKKSPGSESREHKRLKFFCFRWLRANGADDAIYEPRSGPVAGDVASHRLGILIECGNANPLRLTPCLEGGWRIMMVPYQDYETGEPLIGYLFSGCFPEQPVSQ